MQDSNILKQKLTSIDGCDYAGYQSLLGAYDFDLFKLVIQQIPKDPYAPPHSGIYRIQVQRNDRRIIPLKIQSKAQRIACADFLTRHFFDTCQRISKGIRGTGFSGLITINQPGQTILERNCLVITDDLIEIRCFLGLPAHGRRIHSKLAETMIFKELPNIADKSLSKENICQTALKKHIQTAEDAICLRNQLDSLGLTAFIADGSILPRERGTSDTPMSRRTAIPFSTPDSLSREIELPYAGKIKGMGIPKGITLIVGGGYHGKSTLLNALEVGIYDHIPGDGRERCVSNAQAVKIRAPSGRRVVKTDISPFIQNLPFQKDTTSFCTDNASGSTSQAANIIEAIEVGAEVLLMDEDTCAANFMIRDRKMKRLIAKEEEPITPFIDRVKQLYSKLGISTVLVLGGVGEYFCVADRVIQMADYRPLDRTSAAHKIAARCPENPEAGAKIHPFHIRERIPIPEGIDPFNAHGKFAIHAREIQRLNFGKQVLDLTDLEQLMELSQTKALGFAIEYARKYMDTARSLEQVVHLVIKDVDEKGLDVLSDRISGHFAGFRKMELAFILNRLSTFDVVQKKQVTINDD